MKKSKTLLIALLCAITTFAMLGAVKTINTVHADDQASDYVYQDTNVTGIIRAATTTNRIGFVVEGNDYEGHSNYNKGKDYSTISGLNTFTKIKIDGNPITDGWDGNKTDPYLNLWTQAPSFVICQDSLATATEITVEAGCEFPSYALWSGEGNIVYRTTADVTFKKSGVVWVRYENSAVTGIVKASDDRLGFVVEGNDYAGYSNYNRSKDYSAFSGLNTLSKIKIDGTEITDIWDGDNTDPYLNLWVSAPSFVFKQTAFATATEITVEAGCEFPSYALWSETGSVVYKTTEDITYVKKGGVWTRYEDIAITGIVIAEPATDRFGFVVEGNDYEGHNSYNKGKDYANISWLNTFTKIKIDGAAITDSWDGEKTDPYINLWATRQAFVFKQEAFATANEIVVEEGCEFPSYGLWSNTGSVVYKTTETVTFKRVNDAWYKVYTATFVDEEGNTLGSSTFTTADSDLTYPEYDAEIGYDYTWTGNQIKAENITVTLTKTIKTFDVVIGDADAVKYNYGSKLTKPETDPEKAADAEYTYAFIGWYNGETAWDFANDTVTSNITLTAKFSETAIVYTLTFTKVDGSSVTVEYTTLTRQAKLEELKAMLHANDAQYTYTNNLPEVLPFENGRTYAETRTINKYSVTIGDNDPVEVEYGSKLVKPETDPVKAEDDEYTYKFIGWYNGEEAWDFENDEVKGNLTLTAKFEAVAKSADELEDGCEGSVKGSMPLLAVLLIAGAVVAVKKKRV